jgi:hypothetical protein
MATCSLDLTLATSPLPLCRITARVEDCEHHDEITFDRKVHRVGKSPEQHAADARPKGLILERPTSDPIIGSEQLVEKLYTEPRLLVLVPLVRRRDVEIDSRLGNQPILGHRCGLVRRSRTSRAGRARLGSRRYSASRS